MTGGETAPKKKPVGEGKEELAVPLAFCGSVGGRALASIWRGGFSVVSTPYNNGLVRKLVG